MSEDDLGFDFRFEETGDSTEQSRALGVSLDLTIYVKSDVDELNDEFQIVPEPATLTLCGVGVAALICWYS